MNGLEFSGGKLLVYASGSKLNEERLKSVSRAVERVAKLLNLSFEIITFEEKFAPIYVYYRCGDAESVPIYRDKDTRADIDEICNNLRNILFVLSFHPKYTSLRQIRKEIMQIS